MLIINNRFLSVYDYNFLLFYEKIFSVKQPKENNLCFADVSNSKREDLEEEDQRQDERNVIL